MVLRTVSEIAAELTAADAADLDRLIRRYRNDDRAGVRAAVDRARRRLKADRAESDRLRRLMDVQNDLHTHGYHVVAGIDEVGRGALAGPVTAAAILLPPDAVITGIDDSKLLTPARREELARHIARVADGISVRHIDPDVIDEIGIAAATVQAMREALAGLGRAVDHLIVDGLPVDLPVPARFVVNGDRHCACVAAASIVAKVSRDALMRELDPAYRPYGFAANKGYGTPEHIAAIERYGPSTVHRRSFAPCRQQRLF